MTIYCVKLKTSKPLTSWCCELLYRAARHLVRGVKGKREIVIPLPDLDSEIVVRTSFQTVALASIAGMLFTSAIRAGSREAEVEFIVHSGDLKSPRPNPNPWHSTGPLFHDANLN